MGGHNGLQEKIEGTKAEVERKVKGGKYKVQIVPKGDMKYMRGKFEGRKKDYQRKQKAQELRRKSKG